MRILHTTFSGMKPLVEPHLLGVSEAQIAENCKFERGDFRPLRAPSREIPFSLTTVRTIFPYVENGNTHWIATTEACDYAESPILNDPYQRVFFTGKTEPRFFANDNISSGGFDPESDYILLGIPKPTGPITVARVGGAGTETRSYLYIFVNRYGQKGSNSPTDMITDYDSGRVTISGILANPPGRAIDRVWIYRTNVSGAGTAEYQFVCEAFFFTEDRNFAVGEYAIYSGDLYECTTIHPKGAWNAGRFTAGEQVPNEDLGELFDSEHYLPPPTGLKSLILLSNGAMAGVSGNMMCMSEPFQPHAWPVRYQRVCRFQPVACAPLGSDVVVATTGQPTRFYGQHPESMAPHDISEWLPLLEQNSRSMSVWQGAVYWTSKHGMARISVNSEGNATAAMIDSDSWPAFAPRHGTFYNDQYIGFLAAGYGVTIDFNTNTVVRIALAAQAVRVSRLDGALYLCANDEDAISESTPPNEMPLALKKWEGDTVNYLLGTWRSRLNLLDFPVGMAYCRVVIDTAAYEQSVGLIDLIEQNQAIFAGDIGGALGDMDLGYYDIGGDDMYDLRGFSLSGSVNVKIYGDGALLLAKNVFDRESVFSLPAANKHIHHEIEVTGHIPVALLALAPSVEEVMGYE